MNWAERAFGPAEAHYRSQVMADTWGHLAPRRNAKYSGYIVWALGCFGSDSLNPTVLDFKLVSKTVGDLNSSPWFYEAVNDFLQEQSEEEGTVWRFEGYFRNYEFVGTVRQLDLAKA